MPPNCILSNIFPEKATPPEIGPKETNQKCTVLYKQVYNTKKLEKPKYLTEVE